MNLGACEIQVLLTPGHTPSNVSVYVPSDAALYCGDCLINGYVPNLDAGSIDDWREWLKSLERLAALAPRIVVAGHGPVATGDEVPRMIQKVREILRQSIETGRSPTASS
jgi:glyoxylase-like metal-dependent hydrolase (beta-lactamase superfamily II)